MSRILVTGSSTGLGFLAGQRLLQAGHDVIFHARSADKAQALRRECQVDIKCVVGDFSVMSDMLATADAVNEIGNVDAVIHNAGAGYGRGVDRTQEGLPTIFAVNVLAPYVLTAKIASPTRLVYLSSSMHRVTAAIDDALWEKRDWRGSQAYSESKLYVTALAFAVARLWPNRFSNAVDPGWVPTRMGGAGAPDDLEAGVVTQVALASAETGPLGALSGEFLHHKKVVSPQASTRDIRLQESVLRLCRESSAVDIER